LQQDVTSAGTDVNALVTAVQNDANDEGSLLSRDANALHGTLFSDAQDVVRAINALATWTPSNSSESLTQTIHDVCSAVRTFNTAHCPSP